MAGPWAGAVLWWVRDTRHLLDLLEGYRARTRAHALNGLPAGGGKPGVEIERRRRAFVRHHPLHRVGRPSTSYVA